MKRRPALTVPIDIDVTVDDRVVLVHAPSMLVLEGGQLDFTRTKDEQGIVRTVVTRSKRRRKRRTR